MKKLFLVFLAACSFMSCSDNIEDLYKGDGGNNDNLDEESDYTMKVMSQFILQEDYEIPVQNGKVTIVTMGNDTLAITDHPITISVPAGSINKTSKATTRIENGTEIDEILETTFVEPSKIPGFKEGTAIINETQTLLFEDSPNCDYDYNDMVVFIKQTIKSDDTGSKVTIALKPIALGSTRNITFGFDACDGDSTEYILSNNIRKDFFQNKSGIINSSGTYNCLIKLTTGYSEESPWKAEEKSTSTDKPYTYYCINNTLENKEAVKDTTGYYLFTPIKSDKQITGTKYFIKVEDKVTLRIKDTLRLENGTELVSTIQKDSIIPFKFYVASCKANAKDLIPYGIGIPGNWDIAYPIEYYPIWRAFPKFEDWLNGKLANGENWMEECNKEYLFTGDFLNFKYIKSDKNALEGSDKYEEYSND